MRNTRLRLLRDWNTKDEASGFVGYVLRFRVRTEFMGRYEVHVGGASEHREYCIPAEGLQELNDNLVGAVEVYWGISGRGVNSRSFRGRDWCALRGVSRFCGRSQDFVLGYSLPPLRG
jgi:hypothetical protein